MLKEVEPNYINNLTILKLVTYRDMNPFSSNDLSNIKRKFLGEAACPSLRVPSCGKRIFLDFPKWTVANIPPTQLTSVGGLRDLEVLVQ